MTDKQYQRLIGIIFLVGAASASPPFGGLFLVIGLLTMAGSAMPWTWFETPKPFSKSSDGEEGQKSNTGEGTSY
jgi:hypothetical protein